MKRIYETNLVEMTAELQWEQQLTLLKETDSQQNEEFQLFPTQFSLLFGDDNKEEGKNNEDSKKESNVAKNIRK